MSNELAQQTPQKIAAVAQGRSLKEKGERLFAALGSKSNLEKLEQIAGKEMAQRLISMVAQAVRKNHELVKCDARSVIASVLSAAELGLDLSPLLGHGYLIPRWNSKLGINECTFQIGYKGYQYLVNLSEQIEYFNAELVREGDEWRYRKGASPDLHHVPLSSDDTKIIGAYAVAWIRGQKFPQFVFLDIARLREMQRKFGGGRESSPWHTDFPSMARKSAVRALAPNLPIGSVSMAVRIETEHELGIAGQTTEDVLNELEAGASAEVEQIEPAKDVNAALHQALGQ